ncbi:MAG: oligosaccharide flippase family protein [Desulfobacteraceae bacterium]|nr:oligosaccharide flippase family protein [Desulfobacteraceae bacterium]
MTHSKKKFNKYKHYALNASLYLVSSLVSSVLMVLINPLMAMNLSHEDYAIIGYFNSFNVLFMPLINFSFISYYLRNYYLIPDKDKQKTLNTIALSILGFWIFTSSIVFIGFYFYFRINNVSFPYMPYAIFIILQVFFTSFLSLLQANYRIKGKAKDFAKVTISKTIIGILLAVLFVVVLKLGATGRLGASLIAALLIGIYSITKLISKIEFDLQIFKKALKFCWPLAASAVLWYFFTGVDRVFLEKLNDTKTFALYNIGFSISGYLAVFYTVIAQTFEPDIYKSIADKKFNKLFKIITGIIIINAIPILVFVLLATPVTSILTAGRYTDAADFARILSLKNITTSFYYSVTTVIIGFGFTKASLVLRAIGAVLCIVSYKILIEKFGFYGAAWGQVFSFLLMATIVLIYIIYLIKNKKHHERK